ncbi:hypothetical protein LIER_32321 [Lithospermum erythrorhizon]|uniref:Uncharacterized protein n=1 Tax=Lithospermum erythrorhizon TaxID=34254 RepID=A0AAV3RVB2_LITER
MDYFYDEYFSVKVHVGGSFRLSLILDYIGGNIVYFDQVEFDDFGIRDVDEFALRNGYFLGLVHRFVVRPPVTKEIHGRKPRVLLQLSNVDFYHFDIWKYGRVVSDDECEDEEDGEYEEYGEYEVRSMR